MHRHLIRALILTVTFAAGLGLATFPWHRKASPSPKTDNSPITFSCDGIVIAFQTRYHSSDGQVLRHGCYEYGSPSDAERYLHEEIRPNYKYVRWPDGHQTEVHIVERRVMFDGAGNKTGERVVLNDGEILWTEGQRFHLISAPSVEYALLFEDSRSWAWEQCRKLASLKNAPE
jgi:hypothetical protein